MCLCGCHSLIILKMKSRLRKPFRESAIIPSITRRYVCFLGSYGSSNYPLPETDLEKALTRFRDVKKVSLKLGASFPKIVPCGKPRKARAYMLATYQQLLPLYQLAVAQ